MFELKKFRIDHNLKQSDLQDVFGCQQSMISRIENGRELMPTSYIQKLKDKYGDEDVELYDTDNSGEIVRGTPFFNNSSANMIPHIEKEVAFCGLPGGFAVAIKQSDCEYYSIPDMKGCDFTIRTKGRSMINRNYPERSIQDHDIAACKIWTSRSHIRWGEVYALATNDGIVIKKIMPSEKDGFIKCVSFNEEEGFLPYELPYDEIIDWALVVGTASINNWG